MYYPTRCWQWCTYFSERPQRSSQLLGGQQQLGQVWPASLLHLRYPGAPVSLRGGLHPPFPLPSMPTKDAIWQQALPLLPPGAATGYQATLPSLGMDSLDFVELVLHVEQHFGIRFSSAELAELRTVQLLLSDTAQRLRRPLYAEFFAQLVHSGQWS